MFGHKWEMASLHIWLLTSSYGIIFAILSFFQDLGCVSLNKEKQPWIKGILAIIIGILFYFIIGLPHLRGGNRYV